MAMEEASRSERCEDWEFKIVEWISLTKNTMFRLAMDHRSRIFIMSS